MITHTISIPELLWTVWCAIGLVFLVVLLFKSLTDWIWVITNRINGIREYAAINSVIVFSSMALTQFVFVLIGIIAMLEPSPNQKVQTLSYVIGSLFSLASASKTIFAIILVIRKKRLLEKIEEDSENR